MESLDQRAGKAELPGRDDTTLPSVFAQWEHNQTPLVGLL